MLGIFHPAWQGRHGAAFSFLANWERYHDQIWAGGGGLSVGKVVVVGGKGTAMLQGAVGSLGTGVGLHSVLGRVSLSAGMGLLHPPRPASPCGTGCGVWWGRVRNVSCVVVPAHAREGSPTHPQQTRHSVHGKGRGLGRTQPAQACSMVGKGGRSSRLGEGFQ